MRRMDGEFMKEKRRKRGTGEGAESSKVGEKERETKRTGGSWMLALILKHFISTCLFILAFIYLVIFNFKY